MTAVCSHKAVGCFPRDGCCVFKSGSLISTDLHAGSKIAAVPISAPGEDTALNLITRVFCALTFECWFRVANSVALCV